MTLIGNIPKQESMYDAHNCHPLPSALAAGTRVRADARLRSQWADMGHTTVSFPIRRGVLR
jgi:hypothetical protein